MSAPNPLQQEIERHFAAGGAAISDPAALEAFTQLRTELNSGRVRSAEPNPEAPLGWRVNSWVKRGILLGFRIGQLAAFGNHDRAWIERHMPRDGSVYLNDLTSSYACFCLWGPNARVTQANVVPASGSARLKKR